MAAEFHTEGLQYLLEAAMTEEQSVPANFYIGLAQDASLDEADALTDISEVTGTGYARQAVASDNTDLTSAATGTNDRKVTTKTVTFTASAADWDEANTAFLCNVASGTAGKLIASAPLSAARTLGNGETLTVSLQMTLQG